MAGPAGPRPPRRPKPRVGVLGGEQTVLQWERSFAEKYTRRIGEDWTRPPRPASRHSMEIETARLLLKTDDVAGRARRVGAILARNSGLESLSHYNRSWTWGQLLSKHCPREIEITRTSKRATAVRVYQPKKRVHPADSFRW